MNKCERENKSNIECSNPERDPEMFTVTNLGYPTLKVTTECLAHATQSEAVGYTVEIILT